MIAQILDLIVFGVGGFLEWYAYEVFHPHDLIMFFLKQLLMYFLMQVVLFILPFLRRIVNLVWFPFRFLHVYLHVFTAKEIAQELDQKREDKEDLDNIFDRHLVRSSFVTGLSRYDENAMLIASFNRIRYAQQVALAPTRFAWVMLVGYLVISPLALATPLVRVFSTTVGAAIHFYFFMGIFGVMMPTLNDWLFVLNTIILNLNIRPIFIFNAILVHVVCTFDAFWRTQDFLIAILFGTVMFVVYLVGLQAVALFALRGGMRRPEGVFFVPFKSPKELHSSVVDIEFHHLDEEFEWDD